MPLISENLMPFVKHAPFRLKVRLYRLEDAMKAGPAPQLAKVSYPTPRLGDTHMTKSDDIIAQFVDEGGPAPARLPSLKQAWLRTRISRVSAPPACADSGCGRCRAPRRAR